MAERRIVLGGLAVAAVVAASLGAMASPGHAIGSATGGAALALLLCSLVTSPVSLVVPAIWAVACRAARRTLGIVAASMAIVHASLALPSYLQPLTLGPLTSLPWLRHGALALVILVALLVTSFPVLQRALRVKAWSALHRLAYLAAIFASLHALAVPFGSVRVGLAACTLTLIALVARPLTSLVRRRAEPASTDE